MRTTCGAPSLNTLHTSTIHDRTKGSSNVFRVTGPEFRPTKLVTLLRCRFSMGFIMTIAGLRDGRCTPYCSKTRPDEIRHQITAFTRP